MQEDRPRSDSVSDVPSSAGQMVVAVGGSAGGLEAFRGLIAGLPERSGMAYVIVQHLDADHPSLLADLLAKDTPLAVIEAADGMPMMADRIHVIPSGAFISVAGGLLRLSPVADDQGPPLPIDHLLRSLALETDLRVVAIILSGNGADGREGVRAVHDAGGLVIVQDPAEATHVSMPEAAVATGFADAILPVAAMGAALLADRDKPSIPEFGGKAAEWLEPVLARLKAGGHDFSGYKIGTMQRRIERRARMAGQVVGQGADAMNAYIERLGHDPEELQALASDLLINVTSFFRDPAIFETLAKKVLPDLVQTHEGEGPIRLWCAGCSTGEEAWSLAILLHEEIARSRPTLKVQLFGTDLDPDAIATARRGVYSASAAAQISPERLQRFFLADDKGWRVGPALQSSVVFAVHDLLADPPFSRIDMISCRNLLIYLQPAAQARAISLFEFGLRPGGLLLLGSAEAVPKKDDKDIAGFSLFMKSAHLYRRGGRGEAKGQRQPALAFSGRASIAPPWPLQGLPSARLKALEAELANIRVELANATGDSDGADADEAAIHAETVSRNEEYQTTNEELVTSQEELQSLNEELVALNGQLQETIDQQRITSDDLQNILYSTDVATIFLDMGGNIRFFTPATRALFKMLPADIGRPLADLASLTLDSALVSDIAAVSAGHQPIEREVETADGVCFTRRVLPYRAHDQTTEGVIITYADVTEHNRISQAMRAAQVEAEAANIAKSRFLAAASHDLRQPLQALVLLQGLLARNASSPVMKDLLVRLDHTLESMSSMLDGLLDINRIEAGAVDIAREAFSLDGLLAETVDDMALQASERGLKLRHARSNYQIVSDRRLLAGMLQNLVANALKFTSKGGVLLGARRRGDDVLIEVWDCGSGIADDDIDAVFEPYHQLVTSRNNGGLGLGLSIVRSLGNLLGHAVSVRSWPGRGSVFGIRVPIAEILAHVASDVEQSLVDPTEKLARPSRRAAHILVIDDDRKLLDLLGQILSGSGYTAAQALDEASARAAFKAHTPDLIISDFRLLGANDGLELSQSLRAEQLAATGRLLPVIILSGDISIDSLARFADGDCVQLSKPVRPEALLRAIDAALDKAAEAAEMAPQGGALRLVHVIDDDPALLRELSVVLEAAGLTARLHESSEAFRKSFEPGKAGCLVVDAFLPAESGLALIKSLKSAGSLPPTIVITGRGDVVMAVAAMKAGAIDFLEKPSSGAVIVNSIRRALAIGHDRAAHDDDRARHAARLETLTERQVCVMTLVLAGHPSKNIASDLGLSQRTVENHRAEIMRRTGCKSVPELARLVMTAAPEAAEREMTASAPVSI